jgi:3-oxoadipate enol-lactonase
MRTAGDNIKFTEGTLTINYDDYGPAYAPVVIFIHGFPFNKSMWDMQAEVMKNDYRVISYDVRGYGDSRAARTEYSLDVLSSDLIKLMDHLNVSKAAVCGLSMGGNIALSACEKYPDRFSALILSDTHCLPDARDTREERLKIIGNIKTKGIKYFAEESLRHFFASSSFQKSRDAVRAAKKMIMGTSVSSICNTLLTLDQNKHVCGHLQDIKIPVLIMVGREDHITPPQVAEQMHEKMPGSAFHIIEFAGHLPNLENSHAFNVLLKKFMDKVCKERKLLEPLFEHR